MVAAFHKPVLDFLTVVHRTPRAAGAAEFERLDPRCPGKRTLCRWRSQFANDLVYYPNVTYSALRLEHVHLFIDAPATAWATFPYAVRAEWVVRRPGQRTLYLHCLVPTAHRELLRAFLEEIEGNDTAQHITIITSSDTWQVLQDFTTGQPDQIPVGALRSSSTDVWDVVERLPLLLPVIFESVERGGSLPAIWQAIYARLGKRTWDYLPRFARRLPTNGKRYVKDTFALLNHTGLFRQNIVRYRPLNSVGTPMYLRVEGNELRTIIDAFATHATLIDIFPIRDNEALLRVTCTHDGTRTVLSSNADLPRITEWYFVDLLRTDRAPMQARFAYELLFDPTTTEWIFPREELRTRFSQ